MASWTLRFSAGLFLLISISTFSALAAETAPPLADPRTNIVPIQRVNPDYPGRALQRGLDGWAYVSFAVLPGGKTDEVIALRSSSEEFEHSAIDAVSRWKYEVPAEGPGAAGGAFHSVIRFALQDNAGRSGFMTTYQAIEALLSEGKLDEAADRLPRSRDARVRTLVDDAMYHWLAFRIALARKDLLLAADELGNLDTSQRDLPNDVHMAALEAGISLSIDNDQLQKAQDYIDGARINEALKTDASYAAFMEKLGVTERALAARKASAEPLVVEGRHFRKYWDHPLTHHEFALGEVQGELKSVQVRCANTRVQHVEVLIDSGYKLPTAWDGCFVIIEAEPGTRFVLTEYPPEPAAGTSPP